MTVWYFDIFYKIILGICFIEIGILISKYRIIGKLPLWGAIIFLFVGIICSQANGEVEMSATKNWQSSYLFSMCNTYLDCDYELI